MLSAESVDQLLIHCPFAYDIWSMLFGILGLAWVVLFRFLALVEFWAGVRGFWSDIWGAISTPLGLMWLI